MLFRGHRKLAIGLALVVSLAAPAAAQAWTVTVHVHGAGRVDESTSANLINNCTVGPSGKSESSETDCVGGSPDGPYGSGWVVNLNADVPQAAYDRGWRFQKWVDGTATHQIDCDDDPAHTGDRTATNCQFATWDNLYIDLYFDDLFANPVDSLTGGPAQGSRTNATGAAFSFNASGDPDSTFECKVTRDGATVTDWYTCGGTLDHGETLSGLTNGAHVFFVRSVDPSGNVGAGQSRSWTVDTVPPTVGVSGGPSQGSTTNSTSAGFTLRPSETVASLMCKLDRPGAPGTFAACGSTTPSYSNLTTDGIYTFSTYAVDQAGNTGSTTTRSWTVDRTPPDTSISNGPSGPTSSTAAAFDFSATGGAVSYQCKLEPTGDWESCSSGKSYSSLAPGTYTFSVRATDGVGNVESTPATRTFTVDTQPPDTAIDSGPSGDTSSSSASFTFSATEPNVSFECKLDAGPWEPCISGKTYSSLASGSHTFSVRGRDQAGNLESSQATRTWTITASGGTPPGGDPAGGTPSGGGGADLTPPIALLGFSKHKLGSALKKGVVGSGSSTEAGKLRLDVLYKGKKVATSGNRLLVAPGSMKLVAKFSKKWKRALGRVRKAKLTLVLTATDAAGNRTVKKKTVTLKR
jgi:Bacterial Ig-like domain